MPDCFLITYTWNLHSDLVHTAFETIPPKVTDNLHIVKLISFYFFKLPLINLWLDTVVPSSKFITLLLCIVLFSIPYLSPLKIHSYPSPCSYKQIHFSLYTCLNSRLRFLASHYIFPLDRKSVV